MIRAPKRKKESHKGDNGRVLIVGGSKEYAGAIALTALAVAALRTGTDLITVAAPEKVAWAINSIIPDVITTKLKGDYIGLGHYNEIVKLTEGNDVILIGPGIGQRPETKKLVLKLINNKKIKEKPKVIDADALKIINIINIDDALLTPHKKEYNALLKNSRLAEKNVQKKLKNNIILLKGSVDKIISKNQTAENRTGNAGMTVGGTGDLLAGLCAGLIAQGLSLFDAAHTSAYVLGKIGDKLQKRMGYGFIASDFLAEIAKEMKKLKKIYK